MQRFDWVRYCSILHTKDVLRLSTPIIKYKAQNVQCFFSFLFGASIPSCPYPHHSRASCWSKANFLLSCFSASLTFIWQSKSVSLGWWSGDDHEFMMMMISPTKGFFFLDLLRQKKRIWTKQRGNKIPYQFHASILLLSFDS